MRSSIIFFYILKRLLLSFCVITPVVISMVWIAMSIRYINLIASENVSSGMFFKLVLCPLPGIIAIILPICFLISSILAIQKMHSSEEVTVFLTSGKTPISLFFPLAILGIIVSCSVLYLRTTISPMSYKAFENIQAKIKNNVSINLLKPETFNIIGESVIYVESKDSHSLKNVFISYIPNSLQAHTNIIAAKSGEYVVEDNKVLILLNDGYRQEFDKNNKLLATLKFENFTYDISQFFKRFYAKKQNINEKTQKELLEEAFKTQNAELKRNYIAEYHARYIFSTLPILDSLIIAIFLFFPIARGRVRKEAFKSFSCGVLAQAFVIILANVTTNNTSMVYYNYYIIASLIATLSFLLYKGYWH